MRLSNFSDVLGNWIVNVIPACRKAGEAEGVLLCLRSQEEKRVEEFFGFSADKRRSCIISNAIFGTLFKLSAPWPSLPACH